MSTTRPYQDLPISQVVPRRSITRRYASTLNNLVWAFTFAGTMLLTSGAAVTFLSSPMRLPRRHEVAMMAAGSTDDNSTGNTADLSGVPIGIALLCLGVFAYLTALGMYYKDRCSHHREMAMRYGGVCRRGDESPAGRMVAVKAHVPAVTALHVYRPNIKYKVVLVTSSSPVCKVNVKVVDVSRTTTPV